MKTRLSGLFFCAFCLAVLFFGCGKGGDEGLLCLYVSPEGNDSWSGMRLEPNLFKSDGPVKTIARARDIIRALKQENALTMPVHVYIREGTYELEEPIVFTPEDSGTEQFPVIYQAYGDEKPLISGGKTIEGWQKGKAGIWITTVPEVKEKQWYFRQLFVKGQRCPRVKVPNEGFYTVTGEISMDDQANFTFSGYDIWEEWAERGDVEVVALQAWAELRMYIKAVNPNTNTVTLSGKCKPSNREKNARYWIENAIEGLDAVGEWHLDRDTGVLSYLPHPGEKIYDFQAIAPRLTELLRFEGEPQDNRLVSYMTVRGLTFSYTDWSLPENGYADTQAAYDIPAVISAVGAQHIGIENCVINHHGNYAIEFSRGCSDNRIEGNEIEDIGAGGVKIGEPVNRDNSAEKTFGNLVLNNHIHDIGAVYPAACGVIIFRSGENRIAHNEINKTYYTGISNGWSWGYADTDTKENIIEYNHVHHIGRGMLSDMGGNYNLGVQPGTVIRNNLFHDISSYGYGGWGIYTDEGSSFILIENNVVYETKSGGFHQHYGRENIIRNNIFAFAKMGQIIRTRMEQHLSFTFEHNIVYWSEGPLLGSNWNDNNYKLDYNVYYDTDGDPVKFKGWTFDEWKNRGQDVHSIIADPLFVDPKNGDYTLQPDSPALKLGFQQIDLSTVGIQK